jgi:hypothetical protein
VRFLLIPIDLAIAVTAAAVTASAQPAALIQEQTHRSQVMAATRAYRVYLPPAYPTSRTTRYPVIYWFHGYEPENAARDAELAAYVSAHPVILVDSGPADTNGQFPLYFPELIERIDQTLRTIPDRDHRAVTGSGTGGFLAIWQAAKCPDLIASASSFGATPDAPAGPEGFDVDSSLADLYPTLDPVRIRQVAAASSLAETLNFHLDAFAHPLPKPAAFSHSDPYPNFGVWDWEVVSDRRRPAFTVLENVSRAGFRSTVREWIPAGAALPEVKLSITSPRLYTPAAVYAVTYIRLRDGNVRRTTQRADARGRLNFDTEGDAYEIGIGAATRAASGVAAGVASGVGQGVVALSGFEIVGAPWAGAGQPIQVRLKFWNKGTARSVTMPLQWESPTPGVKFTTPTARLNSLASGESVTLPVTFTIDRPAVSGARIVAADGEIRLSIDVPVYPAAPAFADYRIADGVTVPPYTRPLGEGNGDGHAAPGESFAVLLPDAGALRAAELFTNDACVDNTVRISEAGTRISLPTIRATCEPGHRIQFLARIGLNYFTLEIPVWYRNP